jgi:hypothetical protein
MGDINLTEAGLPVFITDGTTDEKAAVLTVSPSSGSAGLAVREVQRGQQPMSESIPVVISSNQSQVPVSTNIEYAEDAAHVSGDVGAFVMGVRNDSATSLTSANGDYSPISVDAAGRMFVVQPTASALNAQVVGEVAHDAVDSGNPVKVGGVARTENPTAVDNGDRVNVFCDKVGRQVVVNGQVRQLVARQRTAINNTTETTILTAGGAGVFHDLTLVTLAYGIDSNNINGIIIDIRDATSGTIVLTLQVGPTQKATTSSGAVVPFIVPLPQTTANSNWTAQLQTSPGSGTVYVSVVAIKNV